MTKESARQYLCRSIALDSRTISIDSSGITVGGLQPEEVICKELARFADILTKPAPKPVSLNTFLIQTARKGLFTVVIIDEAQRLSIQALEQLRLLSNLEKASQKLLQIIFVGQMALEQMSPG